MGPIKRIAKKVLQETTPLIYGSVPIASWPPIMARIHDISVPRAVVPNPEPLPIGVANINILIRLLEQTRDVEGDIAECGVFQGHSLVSMGCYLKQNGISRTVYGFDSFEGFAESVSNDLMLGGTHPEWKGAGVMSNTSLELVQDKARRFGLKNVKLVKGFFENTLPAYSGVKFSLVHLDCDTYDAYRECMAFFYPRMNPGGVILLDEYNDPPWPGCNKALDEFLADKPEKLQMMSLDNHEKYYLVKQG
jgi:hypothetical protein